MREVEQYPEYSEAELEVLIARAKAGDTEAETLLLAASERVLLEISRGPE